MSFRIIYDAPDPELTISEEQLTENQRRAVRYVCDRAGRHPEPPRLLPGDPRAPVPEPPPCPYGGAEQMERNREAAREHAARSVERDRARGMGYVGEPCPCGSMMTKRNGACLVCEACGQTTGCS